MVYYISNRRYTTVYLLLDFRTQLYFYSNVDFSIY